MSRSLAFLSIGLLVAACSPAPNDGSDAADENGRTDEGQDASSSGDGGNEESSGEEASETSSADEGTSMGTSSSSTSGASTSSSTGSGTGSTTLVSSTSTTEGGGTSTTTGETSANETTGDVQGGCAEADLWCEDFEGIANGALPGAPWQLNPSCPDLGAVSLEVGAEAGAGFNGTVGLSSSGASTGTNYCAPLIELEPMTEFWVTTRVKISGEIDMQHEVTFFELGPDASENAELRIGYRGDNSCPGPNGPYQGFELAALNGPSGEYTGCTGMKPVADQWYCLEVFIDQSGSNAEAPLSSQFYIDGERKNMLVHMQEHDTILSNSTVSYIKVGMQSYGGEFDGIVLDDFSVSTTRVGCP